MSQKLTVKNYLTYVFTMGSLGLVGLTFGIVGLIVGLILGFFIARRLIKNPQYALKVSKRRVITDKFWTYAGVGVAGFIFFNFVGLAIGLVITWLYLNKDIVIQNIKKLRK